MNKFEMKVLDFKIKTLEDMIVSFIKKENMDRFYIEKVITIRDNKGFKTFWFNYNICEIKDYKYNGEKKTKEYVRFRLQFDNYDFEYYSVEHLFRMLKRYSKYSIANPYWKKAKRRTLIYSNFQQ